MGCSSRLCSWTAVAMLTALLQRIAPIRGWIYYAPSPPPSSWPLFPQQRHRLDTTLRRNLASLSSSTTDNQENDVFVDNKEAVASFEELGLHPVLLERIRTLGLNDPTPIQSATIRAFPSGRDLIVGSETGSGKTYAYLLPLLNDVLMRRREEKKVGGGNNYRPYDYARALVLVPNKELVQQVVRMALPLAGGPTALLTSSATASSSPTPRAEEKDHDDDSFDALIRLAVVPGGLNEPEDFRPIREAMAGTSLPPDLLFATPAAFATLGVKPKHIALFADIETLIVDEADLCVDGGYVRLVEQVLLGFKRADSLCGNRGTTETDDHRSSSHRDTDREDGETATTKLVLRPLRRTQHVFVAATLPNYGLRSVDRWIDKRFPRAIRVQLSDMHRPRHSGLTQATDWRCVESKRERLRQLVELLQGDGALAKDKTMVFCNSVNDVDGAAEALRLAGVSAAAYHAKLPVAERTAALERFRKDDSGSGDSGDETAAGGVLVCTDLAGRGLDVPNVTAVVQLQFAGNAVAHLHRMGRCGRTGSARPGGRGVIFYSESERDLVQVLQRAEREQEQLALPGDVPDDDLSSLEGGADLAASEYGRDEASDKPPERGTVERAFSRKRGFTKKRKKLRSIEE